ncbi:protein spinster [Eurytemora carolleeae]|uniref:protein spinster n=1 Tax=Eurytemora carolleeae TaxID=1294199 RepID=UPI000C76018B|nr:protein spinster [Eurytemora carolleeae]|eukprot:XP_023332494.1 protein spinster-like [Eurytemora affinis]
MPAQQLIERTRDKLTNQFPVNPSSQQLVKECPAVYSVGGSTVNYSYKNRITVGVLVYVNLINYMDRLTIAGILDPIKTEFGANNAMMGLLQTAFILSYMVFAPLFGYLGDRYSRRYIMAGGVFLWSIFTLIGSFMSGREDHKMLMWGNPDFWAFLGSRAMVGIGEASYSTIAPTIISDMFVKEARSQMLALFYFAIPVGSGLGYIVGSKGAELAGSWQWGLRATPVAGIIAVILILVLLEDPPRGHSEGHEQLQAQSYTEDLAGLGRNMTFVLSTLAFTCVTFCTGALSWWGPVFIEKAVLSVPPDQRILDPSKVAIVFGAVTMMSGIIGVPLGMFLSTKLKARFPRADPIICGCGILISAVLLTLGMVVCQKNIILAFILLFLGEIALNLNWSIVADMLLYVVVPTCRSTAEAVQILFSHAFGDAGSPYLIGVIADGLKNFLDTTGDLCVSSEILGVDQILNSTQLVPGDFNATALLEVSDDLSNMLESSTVSYLGNVTLPCAQIEYSAMLYSLLTNSGVEVIGGLLFFVSAIFLIKDKLLCEQASMECRRENGHEIKLMLPSTSPEDSIGGDIPSDDELPQLVDNNSSRSTTPV